MIHDSIDEAGPEYVIDRGVIARGLRLCHARGNWATYHARALNDLTFGKYDDLDFDADTADLIVQFGLFGEQRYNYRRGGLRAWGSGALQALAGVPPRGASGGTSPMTFMQETPASASHDCAD